MTNKSWRCCIKDPPHLGKKVLCHHEGDIFVAQRFEEYYVPIPFADHPLAKGLCKPDIWQEIDFPNNLTGYMRVAFSEGASQSLILDEVKKEYPVLYHEMAKAMIKSIGSRLHWEIKESPSAES